MEFLVPSPDLQFQFVEYPPGDGEEYHTKYPAVGQQPPGVGEILPVKKGQGHQAEERYRYRPDNGEKMPGRGKISLSPIKVKGFEDQKEYREDNRISLLVGGKGGDPLGHREDCGQRRKKTDPESDDHRAVENQSIGD
jgi:hypothetical protein